MKLKVEAFTILEVVISMIIAALVISISYTSFHIISQSYAAYHRKNADMAELLRLNHWLRNDFDKATIIHCQPEGVSVTDSGQQKISYSFRADYVLREGMIQDTFKIRTTNYQCFFEGQPVEVNETGEAESNRVDELSFTGFYLEEKIPYHYHKLYSSENLIQRPSDAVH